ncbi:hypothetical protein Z517_09652 [Fonsecaea pedrosoi CBS 271.37]|uniref:Uncharacterized protein n=1 Tax=Fonsecaea pedrosoi CBS 271.37 TaxID=1442368 RepID=A0A0D2DHN9_9EURO|nr:uncharacterized protein Z517_09652 [Fonsecaea pedrosoi CBS 271.37]KIW77206.1 hypothetical protein Z517_09652 [Fonsecaea pedrosoi CBS 271.37]
MVGAQPLRSGLAQTARYENEHSPFGSEGLSQTELDLILEERRPHIFPSWGGRAEPPPPASDSMGGPSWDEGRQRWRRTLEVLDNGEVRVRSKGYSRHLEHLADDPQELDAALKLIGQFALAAGKLYCDVYCISGKSRPLSPKQVEMSGFWLHGGKFVTCAHLLQILPNTHVDETVKRLLDPCQAQARVSTTNLSEEIDDVSGPLYPVRLSTVCRASDLAVFVLNPQAAENKHIPFPPTHSIDPGLLQPLSFCNNMLSTDYFAAYYPRKKVDTRDSPLSDQLKRKSKALNIIDACEFMGHENYDYTFISETRSIAVGRVIAKQNGSSPALWYKDGKLTENWDCDIPGFWGCSGGMVCRIEKNSGVWGARVVGIFQGESSNNPKYNSVLGFTAAGIAELQKPHFDKHQIDRQLTSLTL